MKSQSLLRTLSFEKVISNQRYQHFKINILFHNVEYGYRNEYFTEFAAYKLMDRIIQDLDKTNTPINIFLDLLKSFDTVDHSIVLDKLQYYGTRK